MGRRRHLFLVGTEGPVLEAKVRDAEVPDQDGPKILPESARGGLSCLEHPWPGAGYQGSGERWAEEVLGLGVGVVREPPEPVPEKVAKVRAEGWAKAGARSSTGRSSCRLKGVRGLAEEVGGGADLLVAGAEQTDERGLREAVRQRGSVRLRGHD